MRSVGIVVLGLSVLAGACIARAESPAPTPIQTVIEYAIPTSNSNPSGIVAGPDGNLWFTENNSSKIGKVTPAGAVTEYPTSASWSSPLGIALGPDGNLWFTEQWGNIGRISASGEITEYPLLTSGSEPYAIAAGPDGNLWFTEYLSGNIGRIAPDGAIAEFACAFTDQDGNPCGWATAITAGPDGNLWYTPSYADQLGLMSTRGVGSGTAYPTHRSGYIWNPQGLTAGPDGNVWVTQTGQIVRVTPSGSAMQFSTSQYAHLGPITTGPDGNLWFTELYSSNGPQIGRITPAGTITEFPVTSVNPAPLGIAAGPDGNIWFTERDGNRIGVLVISTPPIPVPAISPSSLAFAATAGGAAPAPQTITVSSANSVAPVVSVRVEVDIPWLAVSTPGGAANQVITVSANPAGLVAGAYTGRINITSGVVTQTVTVTLNLTAATSGIVVDDSSGYGPNLSTTLGGPAPMSGGLLIKSAGKDPATYTISSSVVTPAGGNWLSLSINGTTLANGATGTTPASIDIGANVTGLGLGTYAGTIVITPAVGAVQTIPVKLSIIGGTPLVSPARLHFTYQPGGTPPPAQTVQVTDPGGAAVPFVAMMCSINTSAFSVTPSSGTTPATVSVSMNAGLYGTPGTYSSQVCTGPVGQTAAIVEVSYTITPAVETLTSSPLSLSFTYETGGSVPAPQYLQVNALQFLTPIGVAVSTDAKWLSISPVSGGTPATVVTTISPAGLAAGNYLANLTIDSALPGVAPITVPVTLSVTAGAAISASPAFVSAMTGGTNSPPQVIQLIATGNAAIPFTVARGTFSVTPMSGTTPAKLTVSPAVSCSPGTYSTFIAINPATGGNPQLLIPATITVTPDIVSVPASLKFAYRIGGSAPAARTIQIASADSGPVRIGAGNASGSWLVVTPANATPPAAATVSVDPTGLVPGIYTAYVSIGSIAYGSIQSSVPVTLTITDGPPISVAPSGLFDQAGPMPPQPHEIGVTAAGNAAVPFSVAVQGGDGWLSVTPASGVTPATLTASYSSAAMVSGTYAANIVITPGTAGNAETVIPVSVIMNPQYAAMAPHVSAVMNGGSYEMGQVSPGGLVSIFGDRLGPVTPAYLTLDATGKVAASLGGVVVTFDGVPAPLLYVSATQINAVVPYEVAEHQNVDIAVAYGGAVSNEPTLYSSTAQPGVFTQNGSGTGPGAILNQDSSLNTEANPAAVGSVVQIFMTGEGLTTPAQATGAVTEVNTSGAGPLTPAPQQAVSVTIGGQPAPLEFAGEAPGDVAGVLQVNATVPAVASGANPITVQVGANSSQTGVTVWVK